jgi:hypothetical protein
MEVRTLTLQLRTFGAAPTRALVELEVLTTAERVKRAGMIFGAGLIAALIALPIPLVHFVFVPGALMAGIVLAGVRLRQGEIFRGAVGACPSCGTEQRFTIMGLVKLPKKLYCASCQRELMLEGPTTGPLHFPT